MSRTRYASRERYTRGVEGTVVQDAQGRIIGEKAICPTCSTECQVSYASQDDVDSGIATSYGQMLAWPNAPRSTHCRHFSGVYHYVTFLFWNC